MNLSAQGPGVQPARRSARDLRTLLRLAVPTLALLSLLGISAFWHVPTQVHLEFTTTRLALTLAGTNRPDAKRYEILNRSVPFSSLAIERCDTAAFTAEKLEIAVPQPLSAATKHPAASRIDWLQLHPTGPVRLLCSDPSAKLTLNNPDPAAEQLGVLDHIYFQPGSSVVLEIFPGRKPVLSLETETPQDLTFELSSDLELVTSFVEVEGIALPFSGDLLTYRARLAEAPSRTFEITSGKHGLTLIVTLEPTHTTELFHEPLDLPLASMELLQEDLEGVLISPLRGETTLRYPAFPAIQAVKIQQGELLGLSGLSQARLSSLDFDAKADGLKAQFDGIARRVSSRSGATISDLRPTLFDIFRHGWYWLPAAACWFVATAWAAFNVWQRTPRSQVSGAPRTPILFLGVNPVDSVPLRLDEEVRAIDRALTLAALGSRCELVQKWAVRVSELQEYLLSTKPSVVHFSGHGSADRTIAFQGEDGATRLVSADRLARLLARFNDTLRCVVLNACYTKAHGEAIAEHIDCVVGMSTAVSDAAAIRFSTAFYLSVASGCSVEEAFEQAKADIELGELGEDEVPSLVAKRCDPGKVFLVTAG